jgi:proline dehydrogenase
MEDSSTTEATLDLYRKLRGEGHDNVGIVLQAMLRRTLDDVLELASLSANVRICKGIYVEPPDIAYQGKEAVRFAFVEAMAALWEGGAKVAVATHDEWLVAEALRLIEERGLGPERYEFQMLLGVREELAGELVRGGHTLRVYVPYGRRWYEYSLRRLQENPKIAGYLARDTLRRLRP